MQLIQKQREQGILYVGAFLRRDAVKSQADPNRWKDVDKLPEVFDYGTLAQIHWALPTQENSIMLLFGHRYESSFVLAQHHICVGGRVARGL
jgi:hypothetical protein